MLKDALRMPKDALRILKDALGLGGVRSKIDVFTQRTLQGKTAK